MNGDKYGADPENTKRRYTAASLGRKKKGPAAGIFKRIRDALRSQPLDRPEREVDVSASKTRDRLRRRRRAIEEASEEY